ncbi:MAG: VCBS repeat-containing protein [Desulfamplus sp.]|nr:VCBS repeat-containing protein [Desulfamplus sp.]
MKIASSKLSFNSERKYEENSVSKREVETLEERPSFSANRRSSNQGDSLAKQSSLIRFTSIRNGKGQNQRLFPAKIDVPKTSIDDELPADPKLAAMKRMLDAMMGKKVKLTAISGVQGNNNASTNTNNISNDLSSTRNNPTFLNSQSNASQLNLFQSNNLPLDTLILQPNMPEMPTRRIRITEFNSYYESESTKFDALGSVKTESGESINFKLHLDMNREFYSENSSQIVGDNSLIDPLVVNFNGNPAELTDVKFKFDLNSDGKDEEISWLSSGSGFLVFDKNNDGMVNNGGELFGPATNNGFNELEQLDEDKNGWIDENDASFEKLSVWSGDSPNDAKLKSLKESGIGAIAVKSQETEFEIKEQKSQNTLGQIRRTGIYLEENGKAGTIQQLDLAI